MSRYFLRIVSANNSSKEIPVSRLIAVRAETGARYSLLDEGYQPAAGVKLERKGLTLSVEVAGQKLVYINQFYAESANAQFDNSATSGASVVTSSAAGESALVAQLPDWIKPDNLSLPKLDLPEVKWGANPTTFMIGGAALLGVAGLVALGKDDDEASAASGNTIKGVVLAGPIVSGNDLKVTVYKPDGTTVLGTPALKDGQFSLDVGTYTGSFLVKVHSEGSKADYLDETTNNNVDLGTAVLYAVAEINGASASVNVNPLTTLAYHEAKTLGLATAGNMAAANAAIAKAFGLTDLHSVKVVPVNDVAGAFDATSLNDAEAYGVVLAAISGAGNTEATINSLQMDTTVSNGVATLGSAAQQVINTGFANYLASQAAKNFVYLNSASSVSLVEQTGVSSAFYTVQAKAKGSLTYSIDGADKDNFNINAQTGALTFKQAPDFDTKASYKLDIKATDGTNSHQKELVISVLADTTAPTASFTYAGTLSKTANVVVKSSETGSAYLLNTNANVTPTKLSDITAIADTTKWKAVSVTAANTDTSASLSGLADGTYKLYAVDAQGNFQKTAATDTITLSANIETNKVVFDLVQGVSSAHSNRTFSTGVDYTIYVKVNSANANISNDGVGSGPSDTWGRWSGANNLDANDKIILVGSGSNINGKNGAVNALSLKATAVNWKTANNVAVAITQNGKLNRMTNATHTAALWTGQWANLNKSQVLNNVYLSTLPAGLLTNQGLA